MATTVDEYGNIVDDGSSDVPDYSNFDINQLFQIADPSVDTSNYSNEGKNYPTAASTQGPGGSPVNASMSTSAITDWINSKLGTQLTGAQLAKLAAITGGGLLGLAGANKSAVKPVGFQGQVARMQANRNMLTAPPAGRRPGSGGINWGGDPTYSVQAAQGGLMGLAHGGRYLQGDTDGMADELQTSIDGKQPAALSHGEFVIPADVVSHLGNGNSDAGAKKLYSMMDKIREARTGTKKQGKEINPDKFMPGGLAHAYAQGGKVRHFATGDAVGSAAAAGVTGTENTVSNWVAPYVTDMLSKGQALANAPYQQYQGPLTAGPSDLQNQAFQTAGNLSVPASVGQAAQTAGDIANKAANLNYGATNFTNQYQAPTPYQNTSFTSGTFGNEQAQQYMNPYLQQSLNPQLAEARRQAQITAQQDAAKMTQAGAFGGGRQAILQAENERNLGTKLSDITGAGYNTAYTNAMNQFNADQARNLQAQQAAEASKQFGATQGMTSAQNAAQYGQAANAATEASKQFGANLGLQGLQTANTAAQNQGNMGIASGQLGLQNLQQQASLGATQRGIESEGVAADKAAFEAARDNPYKMVQFQQSLLNGLPIGSTNYSLAQPNAFQSLVGGSATAADLLKKLQDLGIVPK
jgi:hypothetical protein